MATNETITLIPPDCEECAGTGVVQSQDGRILVEPVSRCRQCKGTGRELKTYEVKASHTIYLTYAVKAEGYDDAIERLRGIELGQAAPGEGNYFGPDSYVMEQHGIEVVWDSEIDADPSPTGMQHVRRDWEIEEVEWNEDEGTYTHTVPVYGTTGVK